MNRPRRLRKASEEGVPKTLYLRRGVVRRAEREAAREKLSLSAYVDRVLAKELDESEAARAVA